MRHMSIPCEVDFLKLSSYGDEKVTSGEVKERKEIDAQVKNRHIIFVEDIIDTGLSMNYLLEKVSAYQPASVTVVTLLPKHEATHHTVQLDYAWIRLPIICVFCL